MKAWFAIYLSLITLTACTTTAQQPAEEIYQQREALQQIWQGYDPVTRGIGYYHAHDGHVILALEISTPPAHFSQLATGIWRSDEPFSRLRQSFYVNTSLHDTTATVLRYPKDGRNPFNTLFHEDFHGYQSDNFISENRTSTLAPFDKGSIPINTLVAAIQTERALLSAALETDSSERREQILLRYAGLRLWREAQLPSESVGTERRIETSEGTANWVGYRGEQQLLGYSEGDFVNELQRDLSVNYEGISGGPSLRLMTARVYSTGAALSEILSDVSEYQWQALVEHESATLFDILLEVFQWPQDWLEAAGKQFVATEEFTQAIEKASGLSWPDSEGSLFAAVENQYRWKLGVYLPPNASAGFSAASGKVTPLNDNTILLHPVAQFDIETESLSVEIRNLTLAYQSGQGENADSGDVGHRRLTLYLNRIDSSLQCADGQRSCEGTTSEVSQLGVSIRSETPLRYQLERLN